MGRSGPADDGPWLRSKSPGNTRLYDRTGDEITRDEIERVAIQVTGQ